MKTLTILLAFMGAGLVSKAGIHGLSMWVPIQETHPQSYRKNCGLADESGQIVSLPIRLVHGLPVISLKVNGQGNQNFVVDTGSEQSVINIAAASKLHAKLTKPKMQHILLGVGYSAGVIALDAKPIRLDFGNHYMIKGDILAIDLQPFSEQLGIELTGFIGMDILGMRPSVVDYKDLNFGIYRTFRFVPNQKSSAIPIKSATALPIVDGFIRIHDKDGTSVKVLLDTGNDSDAIVKGPLARETFLNNPQGWVSIKKLGMDQSTQMLAGLTGEIQLDGAAIPLNKLQVSTSSQGLASNDLWDVSLGNPTLANSCLLFDIQNKKVYLDR